MLNDFDEIKKKIDEGLDRDIHLEDLIKSINSELIKANMHLKIHRQLAEAPEPLIRIMNNYLTFFLHYESTSRKIFA